MRPRNHDPRFEGIAKMKLQAFRPSNLKSLRYQKSLRSKNRLPIRDLGRFFTDDTLRARSRACGSARSVIQPCSSHSRMAPALITTEIAQPGIGRGLGRALAFSTRSNGYPARNLEGRRCVASLLEEGAIARTPRNAPRCYEHDPVTSMPESFSLHTRDFKFLSSRAVQATS
jgi:hypothetical protein